MSASAPIRVEPYRPLFSLGWIYGLLGAGVWPLQALGSIAYPGPLHRMLMIQGFEQCFVLGFMLTAIQGFTKGVPCTRWELVIAVMAALAFGIAAILGALRVAAVAFVASMLLLLFAVARRMGPSPTMRPPELVFVGFGLLMGLAGGLLQIASGPLDPFPGRLLSLGMVLSLVLGLGSLLVPTFSGMAAPVATPFWASTTRRGRLLLYVVLIGGLASAFVAEALGQAGLGAFLRAGAATVMLGAIWRMWRVPRRRDAPAFALWISGWMVGAGLWTAALVPAYSLGALHLVFIGGFALLTLGIGTRVIVAHGRYPLTDEPRVLSPALLVAIGVTLLARLAAEWFPSRAMPILGVSGALWIVSWLLWAWNAAPRLLGVARPRVGGSTPPS